MRRLLLTLCLLAVPAAGFASSVQSLLPGAEQRGAATFRFLGSPVYEARLFTRGAAPLDWSQDFGIELTYQRRLSQKDLVESTLREMQRLGHPAPARARFEACFQAVSPGDRYLAVSQGPDRVKFLRNGRTACTLSQPGIKRGFMSIFVGANTRSARFTRALLG
ncbi:hypothetical protein K3552_15055 [Leisingera aquaemixtae]|uniref:Chalcone isomerase domain-containing protein n=1 Tax=Leisingera aquaemixtae TaxID=1396826 RepID=A0ABY5WHI0_9RHOB|nr:hypothetical protein [Leisingera aquaemixtae]UWQ36783.1 hypothetical protein K3552_15055 [Leisingera aquaemixtae]UWQ40879.1 hypothetical protein K3718_15250 [Leisingera aquaemixtae]